LQNCIVLKSTQMQAHSDSTTRIHIYCRERILWENAAEN